MTFPRLGIYSLRKYSGRAPYPRIVVPPIGTLSHCNPKPSNSLGVNSPPRSPVSRRTLPNPGYNSETITKIAIDQDSYCKSMPLLYPKLLPENSVPTSHHTSSSTLAHSHPQGAQSSHSPPQVILVCENLDQRLHNASRRSNKTPFWPLEQKIHFTTVGLRLIHVQITLLATRSSILPDISCLTILSGTGL